ncbi:ATP-grasp domain-containing protein [Pseudomonas citronellolis]|uniref:ATP-grasp domain-containing protein n=1 Tax=Pseudomonas citronellolis TaxID=53408 RepID=UPI0023E42DFF|nr:carbamoyl-phosphate-synthetase [Pseudomonas citronellolis]MDF3933835.1 carbamoyl-phosphate-synthetase [Pseudomonas citronellolis]
MKRILFLGAAPSQLPPIRYARKQGHYVITCDYLPDNPGHRLADEAHNVSTTDREAVLALATQLRIDAVVAYASDPAAPTAAYVAERLGLPGNPLAAVETLARKDLFRAFLAEHGFNTPRSASFEDREAARAWLAEIGVPAFVKPVDSSGSKGVTQLLDANAFDAAFDHALAFSRARKVVVEARIPRHGPQVAGDGFVIDGRLAFRCWADENFDGLCNGLVPIGESFPSSHREDWLAHAHAETQRLLDLLGMRNGALNFDFVFDADGGFHFLELGPRNGGCLIPEVIRHATGVDLVRYTVDAALGLPLPALEQRPVQGAWASYMIHALEDGAFSGLRVSPRLDECIVERDLQVRPGDSVRRYAGSHDILGTLILRFPDVADMRASMAAMERDICVQVE